MRTVIPYVFPINLSENHNFTVISRLQFGFLTFPPLPVFSPSPTAVVLLPLNLQSLWAPPITTFRCEFCHLSDVCSSLLSHVLCVRRRPISQAFPCCAQPIAGNLTRVMPVCARKCISFLFNVCFGTVLMTRWGNRSCQSAEAHFLFHQATCFPHVGRSAYVWHVRSCRCKIKNTCTCKPMKKHRTSLHVCLLCHIGVTGPAAVWSTHHVWFISTCLQNNKTWQLDSEPIAALQTSDMTIAAAIMDWSFPLHLWLESKWGTMPQLPGDANLKLPRVWMINWCGCCHIQRDFYISTSACSSSAAKDSGHLEDQVLSSSSSQNPKWLLEVVWSLLFRLNVLIHRVRANLK